MSISLDYLRAMTTKQPTVETPIDDNVEEEVDEYVIIPPDGGFGWVVAFAAMVGILLRMNSSLAFSLQLCNLVCDGTLFAFGTMKIYLQQYFQCSDMLILMVGSVPCGVYLLVGRFTLDVDCKQSCVRVSGPIVSGLANKYGCRPIIIIGSIGAATCMALSTLSSNVWMMMVIYGVVGGIFFGMVYLPFVASRCSENVFDARCTCRSVVMVSFYFEKKRAIANGQSLSFCIRSVRSRPDRFDCRTSDGGYRYRCPIVWSTGELPDEEARLEDWYAHLCWHHALVCLVRRHYETVTANESEKESSETDIEVRDGDTCRQRIPIYSH